MGQLFFETKSPIINPPFLHIVTLAIKNKMCKFALHFKFYLQMFSVTFLNFLWFKN